MKLNKGRKKNLKMSNNMKQREVKDPPWILLKIHGKISMKCKGQFC
jgi:hypothetical protein